MSSKRPRLAPRLRLQNFAQSAHMAEAAFEAASPPQSITSDDQDPRASYWPSVFRSMVLRKYFAEGDDVYVPLVIQTARSLLGPTAAQHDALLAPLETAARERFQDDAFQYHRGNGASVNYGHLVKTILYGWHIHGDADKAMLAHTADGAISAFAFEVWNDRSLQIVRDTRLAVETLVGLEGRSDDPPA